MREIYGVVAQRLASKRRCAIATLVASRGARASAIGTSLVVDPDGSFAGDIGAGCHEGAIVERAVALLGAGRFEPQRLQFDLDDEILTGSGCGASLDIVLWEPEEGFAEVAQRIARGEQDVTFELAGETLAIARRPLLVIVGATALAAQLTAIARRADFFVSVVDPRPPFAAPERHPDADELLVVWPDDPIVTERMERASAIAVLSHDVKLDLPALRAALGTLAVYVGLLGNRRVQRARRDALRADGVAPEQIERIRGPAGLDLGAATDGQTAVSILAEIIAVQQRRGAEPLTTSAGPIHPAG